jgi:phenylacetic acid degradation operon negative regulatory protein
MEPSPKSLILDLLSTLRRGAMPVRALVSAGERLGIPENNLRVALARLLRARLVERDERGRYRIGLAAQAVSRRVTSWRRVEDRLRSWRGHWVAVLAAGLPRGQRAQLRRNERALRLLGFETLEPGIELRPDNLAGGAPALRETLFHLGMDPGAPVVRLSGLDPEREARARTLWDADALRGELRAIRREIEAGIDRLPTLPDEKAMVESFRVGGRALRAIVLDPLLPDAIVAGDERRALVAAMERYDRLGREAWRGFMEAHGVLSKRAPLDTRMTDRPLAAAGGGTA